MSVPLLDGLGLRRARPSEETVRNGFTTPPSFFASAGILLLAGTLAGCADGSGTGLEGRSEAEVVTLAIAPATDTLSSIGAKATLRATARDASGSVVLGVSVTWSSRRTDVAMVSADGAVVAVGPGTATIVAAAGSARDSAVIVVRQAPASLTVLSGRDTLTFLGDTGTLDARVLDPGGTRIQSIPVTWTSSTQRS